MKKLIVAIAAITMAIVANAAQCQWTGAGITLSKSAGAASDVKNYAMYLIDVNTTSVADMTKALSSNDFSKLGNNVTTTSGIAIGSTAARWASTFGSYTAGDSFTYYTVILNNSSGKADQYMITDTKSGTVPAAGNLMMAFPSQASNSWNNVPEPTSAMLLLLGVAGLALRRKQK